MAKYDFEELRRACSGQWESIIRSLSMVDISEAIAKRKHVTCHKVCHGDEKKKHFRLFNDFDESGGGICICGSYCDGFALLDYLNGWERSRAVKEVANFLEDSGYRPTRSDSNPTIVTPPKRSFTVNEENMNSLQKVWSGAVPLEGTLGEQYLRDRGIGCEMPTTEDVRFHPRLHYWDAETEKSLGYFPGIVSLIRSSKKGHPLSIHRIYLDPEKGKAKVPQAKKLMSCSIEGAIGELGAAIRLYRLSGLFMGVTEGIETAMAVRDGHRRLPVWAAYSANVMAKFRPPFGIKGVYIFGDLDRSGTGQAAAARLAIRLEDEGFRTKVCLPGKEICLPEEKTGWYTEEVTREKIEARLRKDGYDIVDTCQGMDWLDVWNSSQEMLKDALKSQRVA